jgi:hypothetical protein
MREVIFILLFILSFISKQGLAQISSKINEGYMSNIDPIGLLPIQISKFIPAGYLPLDTAIGDLNSDGIDDMLLVLKRKEEDTLNPDNDNPQTKRPLLILLGKSNHTYILSKRNDNVVMCINCSGIARSDPFKGIKIKNGYFSVEHSVSEGPQHWQTVTTFKYDKEKIEWYLFKIGSISKFPNDDTNPNADALKTYKDTKTRKDFGIIRFEKYDFEKNGF